MRVYASSPREIRVDTRSKRLQGIAEGTISTPCLANCRVVTREKSMSGDQLYPDSKQDNFCQEFEVKGVTEEKIEWKGQSQSRRGEEK